MRNICNTLFYELYEKIHTLIFNRLISEALVEKVVINIQCEGYLTKENGINYICLLGSNLDKSDITTTRYEVSLNYDYPNKHRPDLLVVFADDLYYYPRKSNYLLDYHVFFVDIIDLLDYYEYQDKDEEEIHEVILDIYNIINDLSSKCKQDTLVKWDVKNLPSYDSVKITIDSLLTPTLKISSITNDDVDDLFSTKEKVKIIGRLIFSFNKYNIISGLLELENILNGDYNG